jgi:hypothetical protein
MIGRILANPEVMAAVIALVASALFALTQFIRMIPRWIDQRIELRQSEVDARAMRDRAVADALNHAAGTNAQALSVILALAETLRDGQTAAEVKDQLTQVSLMLHNSNRQLKELNERLNRHEKPEDASLSHDLGGAG